MKKVLITGKNSYVGTRLMTWLGNFPDRYSIDSISLRDDSWKDKDFSGYDVVVHVAGIAHIKETKENAELYYRVNRDLAYEVAQKAKIECVKQFIFLSSMSVYGKECGVIDKSTPLKPKSNYGKSKLQAEELITTLEDPYFKVAILRPPMIYGKGCKGNYPRLANLAVKIPVFPLIENKRSMIFIDNLCEFIRLIIDDYCAGVFFPQNEDYVCTSEMVKIVAELHGTNIRLTKMFNPLLRILRVRTINKVFGDLIYDKQLDEFKNRYTIYDFKTSISLTEN
ncbi:NAD-dependent epimerase/dehydratase family protein [Neobacillus thermocopriae]|uniref:NAD-dependent epimerase/dehydratase family protein n=1 Tax=Neobacillus thermocopriae TaxID=1215031 RepID=UPI002E1AC3A9|nr:NAD-dependent epimerase/dehydratase family protein [Neobacillus thermocopriae]MED3623921.1 NAD-dependent epimerase/dehydratase family protein [Neobacillus thermocopriae]MED3713379.1 NAD-dependent epimerase/dehydratase family protein [Neobacillus thermocopriae]